MRKMISVYTLGVVLVVVGIASFVQSVNPSFLASADSINISRVSSSATLAVIAAILFIAGLLIIILKVMKGKTGNGKERYQIK